MAERYRTLVSELNAEISSKQLLLEKQERVLSEERERLDNERETMQLVPVSNDELIHMNVGGTIITAKRGVLRVFEGSVLDLIFSGRWEDRIVRDNEGRVFLDYDPDLFRVILRYLSAIHTYGAAAEHLEIRPIPNHLEAEFRLMLAHLGLHKLIQPTVQFKWSPILKSPGVTLQNQNTVAVANAILTLRHFILSESIWKSGLFQFEVSFDLIEEWLMIGIIRADVTLQPTEDSCIKEGVYGFGSNGEVFINGVESSGEGYPGRKFSTGDRLKIELDCRYSTLVLKASIDGNEVEYKIPDLMGRQWRLLLATYFGSSIVSVKSS
eukprot:g4636.t1